MNVAIGILIILALGVFIGMQIYLIILLFRLNESVKKINRLVDILEAQIPEILENLRITTLKVRIISQDFEKGVRQVSKISSLLIPINSFLKLVSTLIKKRREE
ncbi:MAG: hypothetical protein QMD82_01445 [bacterium]|nr:hypothetical protein [bacterium]